MTLQVLPLTHQTKQEFAETEYRENWSIQQSSANEGDKYNATRGYLLTGHNFVNNQAEGKYIHFHLNI